MTEIYVLAIVYVGLVIWLTKEGSKRNIGWLRSLLISFLLTPIIGFIIVYNSNKKIAYYEIHYRCKRCGYEFTERQDNCPLCEQDGHDVPLRRVRKMMT